MNDPIPNGLRVLTCGHSFHVWVAELLNELARGAGLRGHEIAGLSSIGGSTVSQHWDAPEPNPAKAALSTGTVEVMTLSPIWLPDEGIAKLVGLAAERNPAVRVTIQEFWLPNDTYEPIYPLDTRKPVDHDATGLAELRVKQTAYRRDIDACVSEVNRRLGKEVAVTVPVGLAAVDLRDRIEAGTAPGLQAQNQLFMDSWGHPKEPLKVLSAYCHFAVIYRRSPAGLPVPAALAAANLPRVGELNALLQAIAWEAVTSHPLSGIARRSSSATP